jgi:hypothetical protein
MYGGMARFRILEFRPSKTFQACRAVSLGMAEAGGRVKTSPPGPITIIDVTLAPRITGQALAGCAPWCDLALRGAAAPVQADASRPTRSSGVAIRAISRRMPVRRSVRP